MLMAVLVWFAAGPAALAVILWSDGAPRVVHKTPEGLDILGGTVKRDDTASDALYFKFHVNPLSDWTSEEYFAVFRLALKQTGKLAVGNAPEAWAYSAANAEETGPDNRRPGEFNLKTSQPAPVGTNIVQPYEVVLRNQERTIVFKVQYVPGGDDLVTVWLSPDLARGATSESQPAILTTQFKADASFDQVRLCHGGGGDGWIFSGMAIATSFSDFIVVRFWQTWWFVGLITLALLAGVVMSVRISERRRYQRRLHQAESERALERERARIARDLHDDLGSSLARISLLSSLARDDKDHPEQVLAHVTKIAQSADDTVRALEEIVWAVRPDSDSLQSLVEYIAHFSNELFEGNGTRCRLDLPHDLPALPLPPEIRHNIFLVVKEALTNVLKHAGAKEVRVQAKATGTELQIVVQDDGRGFEPSQSATAPAIRDGLVNMRRRAEAIRGRLTVDTSATGTAVRLVVSLDRIAKSGQGRPPSSSPHNHAVEE
jgi:signal transduction histidine kinase